jgi:preprotein translocase subunit SecD
MSSVPRQAGTGVRLVYRARAGTKPVTTSSLRAAIAIMRRREEGLGVTRAIIRGAGADEIEVALPAGGSAAVQEGVAETGQLYFYAWEPNVIGAGGRPAPGEGSVTGDESVEGPGGHAVGLTEYRAVLRAGKRPPILRKTDTTWRPGCTPRQVGGCSYGSWYLLDAARERVLQGPAHTEPDLYAQGYRPPVGATPRAVRVNPGTVLVQARAIEAEKTGRIINASPNSWYVLNDNPALGGADLINPARGKEDVDGRPDITFGFTPYGRTAFERVTKEIAHRGQEAQLPGVTKEEAEQHLAVVLDGQLLTVPSIDFTKYPEGIDAATGSEISGGFTIASAQGLAGALESGPLPIGLELEFRGSHG